MEISYSCSVIQRREKKEDVSDYRPVSLLPVPGKIIEKLVHDHIMKFFTENDSLCEKQNGFRPGHSTTNSIINLTNDIYNATNCGQVTVAAFIDLKKAFDTVNHKILLEKLNYMGIRKETLIWIENYLDIKNILGDLKYQLYADDTVIYCSGNSYNEANEKLQKGIDKFALWCSKNALTINTKKTKVMKFGSSNKIKKGNNINIFINKEKLGIVPTYKYLGINLDQTLSFKYHTGNLVNLINHKLYMFSKIRRYLNDHSAISIYKTMILPYVDYGDICYMSSNIPEVKKLNNHHIRGLRICFRIQGKIEEKVY